MKTKPPLERHEDAFIRRLYRAAGCTVYTLSQPRATKQTPGLPDMLVFGRNGWWWWHEVKRRTGPEWTKVGSVQSDAQKEFGRLCAEFGIIYVCGAREAAEEMLRRPGMIL